MPEHVVDVDADWRLGFSTDLEMIRLMYPYGPQSNMKYLSVLYEGCLSGMVRQGKISFETRYISPENLSTEKPDAPSIEVTDLKNLNLKKKLELSDGYFQAAISQLDKYNGSTTVRSWVDSRVLRYCKMSTQTLIAIANNENLFASAAAVHQALSGLGIAQLMVKQDEVDG
jgi:hypothetical protein